MIRVIRSGGQTGVDRAALAVAVAHGYEPAGYCPAGYRAEDGTIPFDLRHYLTCTPTPAYEERTRLNVEAADATLILADGPPRGGSRFTLECALRAGRPVLVADLADPSAARSAAAWLRAHPEWVSLNVAGPRESELPGVDGAARDFLTRVLSGARGAEDAPGPRPDRPED